ncbi:flagellar export chaperone FliS [Rhodovibrio salinarum]|nr:flagellar export chaperone FliS [Rhodovibrio salinarum]
MYGNAAYAYQTQQVKGASKVKQVALLYDRILVSLREAIEAVEKGEIERRWRANKRAQDIIFALYGSLDEEQGGEITRNLSQLYMFCLRRLPQVDLKNDATPAKESLEILEPLAKSWRELAVREQHGPLVDGDHGSATGAQQQTEGAGTPAPEASSAQSTRDAVNLVG